MAIEKFAPIIIFAFNRLDTLKACVEPLKRNKEATPRENKERVSTKVEKVKGYVVSISDFCFVKRHFSATNKGLTPSIISGVSEVLNRYGRTIVIEDDFDLAPSFLSYMIFLKNSLLNTMMVRKYSACRRN